MELYTLVSIAIGIFGAAYAALNSLRTNLDPELKKANDTARDRVTAFVKMRGATNKSYPHCEKHAQGIKTWNRVWKVANIIPSFCFFLLIVGMMSSVLFQWDQIIVLHKPEELAALRASFPWSWARPVLAGDGVINLLCVLAALFSWVGCRSADRSLQEHADGLEAPSDIRPE